MRFSNKNLLNILLALILLAFSLLAVYFNRLDVQDKNIEKAVNNSEDVGAINQSNVATKSGELSMASEHGLNMLFFGDMMLDRHVGEKIKQHGLDYIFKNIHGSTTSLFSGYDLIGANLEGAVTDKGVHYKPDNAYDFAFAPELINSLKKYNFSFFNLANNHLSDQGQNGIIETHSNLDKLGFLYSGCKDAEIRECSATSTVIAGQKIALLGFSQVYRSLDLSLMIEKVKTAASSSDIVIINMHWGLEYEHNFSSTQQKLGRAMVDAGADIIIGHHPHVVQGLEIYKNKPIFYSLGNFIFDQYFSADTQEELGVGIRVRAEKINLKLFPLKSGSSQLGLMSEAEKEIFLQKFISWSELEDKYQEQVLKGEIDL